MANPHTVRARSFGAEVSADDVTRARRVLDAWIEGRISLGRQSPEQLKTSRQWQDYQLALVDHLDSCARARTLADLRSLLGAGQKRAGG